MKNFGCYSPSICFAPEIPPEDKPADPPAGGFTEDQQKAMVALMNQVVTSQLKRQPSFADQLKEVKWGEMLAPVLKDLVPATETKPADKNKPEISEYEKQLAKLTNDLQNESKFRIEAENKAKASESARRNDAGKLKLRSALTSHVTDGALDHVINHLTVVTNRMVVDDDGNAKLRVRRPELPGMPPIDMEVSIEDGIKDILSEPDMKIFIPAPAGKGGANPGPGSKGVHSSQFTGEAKTDAEKIYRAQVKEAEIAAKYGQR